MIKSPVPVELARTPHAPLDLRLGWLETFLCLVDHQLRFDKVAAELSIDPTSVVERISNLETWCRKSLISEGPNRGFYHAADDLTLLSVEVLNEFDKNRISERGVYSEESRLARQAVSTADLQVLIAVANSKSRSAAAHTLGKSESAISRSLKKISLSLNNPRLLQGRSRLSLSGDKMVRSAERILSRINGFREESSVDMSEQVLNCHPGLKEAKALKRGISSSRVDLEVALKRLQRSKKGAAYVKPRISEVLKKLALLEELDRELMTHFGSSLISAAAHIDMTKLGQK